MMPRKNRTLSLFATLNGGLNHALHVGQRSAFQQPSLDFFLCAMQLDFFQKFQLGLCILQFHQSHIMIVFGGVIFL